MLTGKPAFAGSDVSEILAAVLKTEPDWASLPQHLHPRLREATERCLEKDVKTRFRDIGDVRFDLQRALGVRPGDPRAERLCRLFGLSVAEAFQDER